jgi:hypothetical protein
MRATLVPLLVAGLAVGLAPRIAQAEPVTFQFAGVVIEGFGELGSLGGSKPGTPFSGRFTYDPMKAVLPPELAEFQFIDVDPPAEMTIRLGTLETTTTGGIAFVADAAAVISQGFNRAQFPFQQYLGVSLLLGNPFEYAAPTAETLERAFDPARARFSLNLGPVDDDPTAEVFGALRSFTLDNDVAAPVPEPATMLLVGSGAFLVALRHRRARGSRTDG